MSFYQSSGSRLRGHLGLPANMNAAHGQGDGQGDDEEGQDSDPPFGTPAQVVGGGDPGGQDGYLTVRRSRRRGGVGRG